MSLNRTIYEYSCPVCMSRWTGHTYVKRCPKCDSTEVDLETTDEAFQKQLDKRKTK